MTTTFWTPSVGTLRCLTASHGARLGAVVAWMTIAAGILHAQNVNTPPYQEIWNKSQQLRPQPSTDTEAVAIEMTGTHYRIPRNYLVNLDPAVPTLRLTWPGLQPRTDENAKCFTSFARVGRVPECTFLEFTLCGKGLNPAQDRENLIRNLVVKPRPEREGYSVFHIGPDDNGSDNYWKNGPEFATFFWCFTDGICNDTVQLADGNCVRYFFYAPLIPDVTKIEDSVRTLMKNLEVSQP